MAAKKDEELRTEIDDREQKEQERLQKEAEEERKKASQRFKFVILYFGELGFDTSDPKTRLICKVPSQTAVWTSPVQKTVHVVELYWRTKEGNYFKFVYDEEGAIPIPVGVKEAHYIMNTRKHYQWFLTDLKRRSSLRKTRE